MVAGSEFYSNYIHQGKIQIKKGKLLEKVLCIEKDVIHFLKDGYTYVWVQFHVYRSGQHPNVCQYLYSNMLINCDHCQLINLLEKCRKLGIHYIHTSQIENGAETFYFGFMVTKG